MRKIPEFDIFIRHHDWYVKDEKTYHYIPTDKAPPEAVEAMKSLNERIDWEKKQGGQY